MRTKLTLLAILVCAAIGVNAQNLITVQHAGTAKFYTKLPDAITGAAAGDTVLIPGGSFDAITISKRLTLIGVGSNPDSTKLTARTLIPLIVLAPGADNGSLTGISCPSDYVRTTGSINGYTISRCNIFGLGQQSGSTINNFTLSENIIVAFDINGTNNVLYDNIFMGNITINNSVLKNNLFILRAGGYALTATNCTIDNNFMEYSSSYGNNFTGTNNILNNNINCSGNGILGNNNQGYNNFTTATTLSQTFPTYDPSVISSSADGIYKIDFHLPPNSPYKNAGRDGTDIGIYGGAFPWKEGSVPFNPHFQNLQIAPKTDSSGNLKVQITVAAQNQ